LILGWEYPVGTLGQIFSDEENGKVYRKVVQFQSDVTLKYKIITKNYKNLRLEGR
jgi:hypothetical protein